MTGRVLAAAVGCALVAALGVVLLARDYPAEPAASATSDVHEPERQPS